MTPTLDDALALRSSRVPLLEPAALSLARRPLWVFDPLRCRLLHANAAALVLWNAPDLRSLLARDLSAASDAVRIRTAAQMPAIAAGEALGERATLYPGGRAVTCDLLVSGVRCGLPGEEDRVVMLIEATPLEVAPAEVRALEALRHTGAMVTLYDEGGAALFRNPAATAAYPDARGRFSEVFEDREEAARLWAAAEADGQAGAMMRVVTAAGARWHGVTLHRTTDPAAGGAAMLVDERDMTGEQEARARVEHAALHDTLTGLANRMLFARRLDAARAEPAGYTLFMLDLDRFKPVNDGYGHAAGDAVLVAAADRLRAAAASADTVARLGGDEFAVIRPGGGEADAFAERLVHVLREPVAYAGRSLRVGASVGFLVAERGMPGEVALLHADSALYEAKRRGRGRAWTARAPRAGGGVTCYPSVRQA